MRLAIINSTYGFGSTGVIARDIAKIMISGENQVAVYCQERDSAYPESNIVGNIIDWKMHAVMTRVSGKQGGSSKIATYLLIRSLSQFNPDVIHIHNIHSNFINIKLLLNYINEKQIATVVTLHDCWLFTGKCCHFSACDCDRWQRGCGKCPQKHQDVNSLFFDRSHESIMEKEELFQGNLNLTVVACSDWISCLAKKSLVFQGKRIITIRNGVDLQVFKPLAGVTDSSRIKDKFVIMGMANKWLSPLNSKIFDKITGQLESDEVLLIAGCTQSQEKMLAGLPKVITYGYISSREKLAALYAKAGVFVNLTYEDTLPTVNMEAICCGTPVVTYDSCGSPELIDEGVTGYVVPQGNYRALRESIDKIKKGEIDSSICSQVGSKRFNGQVQYRKYLELYSQLMENRD